MSVISLEEWRKKQGLLSKLKYPSPQNIPWEQLGLLHTEVNPQMAHFMCFYLVLDRAWRQPFSISGDFSRKGAFYVAIAASEGLITTNVGDETYAHKWIITEYGMDMVTIRKGEMQSMEAKGELDELLKEVFAIASGRDSTSH